jgi:hypothetical protein
VFGGLFGRARRRSAAPPFYRPYSDDGTNLIYNLLFCDDPTLFRKREEASGPYAAVLSDTVAREMLERIGNDLDVESRIRALAFNRLRAMGFSVPPKRLLGAIVEVPQKTGLDVLAAFADGRLRYINQSGQMAIFEATPPELTEKSRELLRLSQFIVNRYGPWNKQRLPPPQRDRMRLSFLVSDGLYFGEGRYADLTADPLAQPVVKVSTELLVTLINIALAKDRENKN